jgi:hypothetical protein
MVNVAACKDMFYLTVDAVVSYVVRVINSPIWVDVPNALSEWYTQAL